MKIVLIFWVVLVYSFVYSHEEKASVKYSLPTQGESLLVQDSSPLSAGMKKRILNRYVFLKEAFTSAVEMDFPGQNKASHITFHSFLSFFILPPNKYGNGFYIGKYTDILSVRYQAGYYLFFLKKLLI